MREIIRQIALDIIIIGGALCIIGGFVLIVQWIRISATWMKVTSSIKHTTQQLIDVVTHPLQLVTMFIEYRLAGSLGSVATKSNVKKKSPIKTKKA